MFVRYRRFARRVAFLLILIMVLPIPAMAVDISGGIVVQAHSAADEKPLVGAKVTVQDQDHARPPVQGVTDANGKASFQGLLVGNYVIHVAQTGFETDQATVVVSADVTTSYSSYLDVAGGEKVIKVRENVILVNPDNPHQPSTTRDQSFIQNQITNGQDLQKVLSTDPGVNTDSLGQVHVRGEHKSVSLSVDGIDIPMPTESVTTQFIDPRFLDQLQVLTGGYDASEGGQLGAIFNFVTKTGPEKPYVHFEPLVGDNGVSNVLLSAGGSNPAGTFNYFVGATNQTTNLFTEAPNPTTQNINNTNTAQNYIVRLTRHDDNNSYGLTLNAVSGTFGVVQNPQDAAVQQFEHDTQDLAVLSWNHKFNARDNVLVGLSYLKATETYANNGAFTPFVLGSPEFEAAAGTFLAANGENPGAPYLPNTNLDIEQFQPSLALTRHYGDNNDLKVGATYNAIYSSQVVNISMPGAVNSNLGFGQQLLDNVVNGGLLPGGGGTTLINGIPTFNSFLGRHGAEGSAYFSRTLPIGKKMILNFGLRADRYEDGLTVDESQLSPLVNASFITSDTSAIHLSYNRLFQPPPLELDTSGNSVVEPQRTSAYSASYEWQTNKHTVAQVSAIYKDYQNQVDVALLVPNSGLPLFAPVNFGHGFYKGIDAGITSHYETGWNYFLSTTYSEARPTEPGPFDTDVPDFNDHDQRVQVTGGLSHTWLNGTIAAMDFLYGSGYPLDGLVVYNQFGQNPFGLSGDRIPRFVMNGHVNFVPLGPDGKPRKNMGFGIGVDNLFDQRGIVNFASGFAGTRFLTGRQLNIHGRWAW